jgi:hypothetical protein
MATRGFENFTTDDLRRLREGKVVKATKPSKYRNVRCEAPDGQRFDSRRECNYYLTLKAREARGELTGLRRQVRFWLLAPTADRQSYNVVSFYIADFVYRTGDVVHVVDAKGRRTQLYVLKKKWLELQEGVVVEEV